MRLLRMTTRRWIVVVALLALAFGGVPYAVELKQRRDRYVALAMLHSSLEAKALQWLASGPAHFAYLEPRPAPMLREDVTRAVGQVTGLAAEGSEMYMGHVRFRENQEARKRGVAAPRQRIMAEYRRRELRRHRELVDYHAALARKYRHAASRPWLSVEPDPPKPK